jgi:hypothetical protein
MNGVRLGMFAIGIIGLAILKTWLAVHFSHTRRPKS